VPRTKASALPAARQRRATAETIRSSSSGSESGPSRPGTGDPQPSRHHADSRSPRGNRHGPSLEFNPTSGVAADDVRRPELVGDLGQLPSSSARPALVKALLQRLQSRDVGESPPRRTTSQITSMGGAAVTREAQTVAMEHLVQPCGVPVRPLERRVDQAHSSSGQGVPSGGVMRNRCMSR